MEATNLYSIDSFSSEEDCIKYFEGLRWPSGAVSPFIGEGELSKVYVCKRGYKCSKTGKYFTVRTGTIFSDSNINLRKWFLVLHLLSANKKGISSYQVARHIGVTQQTAWFMLHRLRYAVEHNDFTKPYSGVIEADETYTGGKHMFKHKWERDAMNSKGTGAMNKQTVFGILERPNNVMLKHIDGKAIGQTLKPVINHTVKPGSIVITDGAGAYAKLTGYKHSVINHEAGEFGRGVFHTNSIEGAFSHFKRMVYGTYHQTSVKHLQTYCNEFSFRWNTRKLKDGSRFDLMMKQTANGALKYKDLVGEVENKRRYTRKIYRKGVEA